MGRVLIGNLGTRAGVERLSFDKNKQEERIDNLWSLFLNMLMAYCIVQFRFLKYIVQKLCHFTV